MTDALDGDQLTDLIVRLLIDSDLRERLATEGARAVASNTGELECLETIDHKELDTTARRFRSGIWRLGRGGIRASFPMSLRMLSAADAEDTELLSGFLASRHFGRFRLIPYTGPGLSVEECFASFLLDFADAEFAGAGEARLPGGATLLRETVNHELMIALFAALACDQPLSFVIATQGIISTGRGHAALRWYSPDSLAAWKEGGAGVSATVPYAYFTTSAGVARGVVSDRVAAAFEPVPTAEGDTARRQLSQRGLW
jgi:hypothetical protein